MKFKVTQNPVTGLGSMTFTESTDIETDIFMSLNTRKGTFFQDKNFGLEPIGKITKSNIMLLQQNCQSALKWLILAGAATKIDVLVEQDLTDIGRLDIKVSATQANGYVITYQQFYYVGGPTTTTVV